MPQPLAIAAVQTCMGRHLSLYFGLLVILLACALIYAGAPKRVAIRARALRRFVIERRLPLLPLVLVRPAAAPLGLEQASANFQRAKAKMLDRQSSSMPRPFAGIFQRACETRLPRPSTYLFDRLLKTD